MIPLFRIIRITYGAGLQRPRCFLSEMRPGEMSNQELQFHSSADLIETSKCRFS